MNLVLFLVIGIISLLISLFINNNKNNKNNKNKNMFNTSIKTLTRQAARWSTAASQDENPMIAILHANYGAAYLWAVRDIATDFQIKEATGIDILKFRDAIIEVQDLSTKKMVDVCPKFAPKRSYLTNIGGE